MSKIVVTSESIKETGNTAASVGITIMLLTGGAGYMGWYTWWSTALFILGAAFFWSGTKYAMVGVNAEAQQVREVFEQNKQSKPRIDPTF